MDGSKKVRYLSTLATCRTCLHAWRTTTGRRRSNAPSKRLSSAKLVWLRQRIDAAIGTSKIVAASGLYVQGVTQPVKDDDEIL